MPCSLEAGVRCIMPQNPQARLTLGSWRRALGTAWAVAANANPSIPSPSGIDAVAILDVQRASPRKLLVLSLLS